MRLFVYHLFIFVETLRCLWKDFYVLFYYFNLSWFFRNWLRMLVDFSKYYFATCTLDLIYLDVCAIYIFAILRFIHVASTCVYAVLAVSWYIMYLIHPKRSIRTAHYLGVHTNSYLSFWETCHLVLFVLEYAHTWVAYLEVYAQLLLLSRSMCMVHLLFRNMGAPLLFLPRARAS